MTWVTTTQVLEELGSPDGGAAWRQLHDHFYAVIVQFAQKLGLSAADAEDAAQETMITFLEAFRKGKYRREKGRLSQWLFGVARRTIHNVRKHLPPERQIINKDTGTSFWDRLPDDQAEHKTWTAEWQKMVMERCLQHARRELQPKTFQAFEMYSLGQVPVEQVAQHLQMTANAVYIAKNRVLTRLQELESEFEGMAQNDEPPIDARMISNEEKRQRAGLRRDRPI